MMAQDDHADDVEAPISITVRGSLGTMTVLGYVSSVHQLFVVSTALIATSFLLPLVR